MSGGDAERPLAARLLRRLAVPIVLGWLVFAVVVSVFVPRLDLVERQNSVGLLPKDAPSLIAMKQMGKVFHEFDSDSVAMVVLVGDKPLGDEVAS